VRERFGESLRQAGDSGAAKMHLNEAADLMPDDPAPLRSLKDLYASQNKWEEVVRTLRRRMEAAPDDERYDLLVEAGELDASVRAMAMAASEAAAPAYDSLSSRDERLVAIGRMSDTATLDALLREREPVLAAAAVLRLGAVADAASRLAWLRGAAAEAPVLRAAWYASAPDDAGAREWALRRETHPGVRAVLAGATALSAPVIVSAYDQTTGAPRPNELVVGFTADGSLVHARTDVFGRVRWDRDDLRAVFVVGEAL